MSQSASATSSANGLIRALSAADRDRLQRAFRVVPLARGEVIHEAGEPIDAVHFPLDCVVSLLQPLASGSVAELGACRT